MNPRTKLQPGRRRVEILPGSVTGDSEPLLQKTIFQCTFCGQQFSSSNGFIQHKRIHLGQFRYYCDVCARGFMGPSDLRGHMAKHTKKKDFSCDLCDKEFAYKTSLVSHIKKVHDQQFQHIVDVGAVLVFIQVDLLPFLLM